MFETLKQTPPDAIIGLSKLVAADTRADKIDLGVGIYQDERGATPVMRAIKEAETRLLATEQTKKYVGIHGNAVFNAEFAALALGAGSPLLSSGRIAMAQSAGGSGALRLGTELIKLANPNASVWVSTPTWANHTPLIGAVGLPVKPYPYYNKDTQQIDFEDMCAHLRANTKPGDALLLHACCHNPTGADLSKSQWDQLPALIEELDLLPYIDIAYMGLGDGIDEDAYGLRLLADKCEEMVIAVSASKNFGLYKERTGLVMAIARTPEEAALCNGQIGLTMRRMISMPPDHGASLVATVLTTPELRADWKDELDTMRNRMSGLRSQLSAALNVQGYEQMAAAVGRQKGMFSLLPVTPEQAQELRADHGVYMLNSGRINIGGARVETIDALAAKILKVI